MKNPKFYFLVESSHNYSESVELNNVNSFDDFKSIIVNSARSFHCDYDSVRLIIVSDENSDRNNFVKLSDNLLVTGGNGDTSDMYSYDSNDNTYYDHNIFASKQKAETVGQLFNDENDMLKQLTLHDDSGDINAAFNRYMEERKSIPFSLSDNFIEELIEGMLSKDDIPNDENLFSTFSEFFPIPLNFLLKYETSLSLIKSYFSDTFTEDLIKENLFPEMAKDIKLFVVKSDLQDDFDVIKDDFLDDKPNIFFNRSAALEFAQEVANNQSVQGYTRCVYVYDCDINNFDFSDKEYSEEVQPNKNVFYGVEKDTLILSYHHTGRGMNYGYNILEGITLYEEGKKLSSNPDQLYKKWETPLKLTLEDIEGMSINDVEDLIYESLPSVFNKISDKSPSLQDIIKNSSIVQHLKINEQSI